MTQAPMTAASQPNPTATPRSGAASACREMTQGRVGEPVRRLRPLLPQQADRRGHQRDRLHRRRLQAARRRRPAAAPTTPTARRSVPDCVRLTPRNVRRLAWLPPTCAYRLVANGGDLPWWHPLDVRLARHGARGRRLGARARDARARRTCRTSGWRNIWWRGRGSGRGGRGGGNSVNVTPSTPSLSNISAAKNPRQISSDDRLAYSQSCLSLTWRARRRGARAN